MTWPRKTITDTYIRTCRDSGFGLSFDRAAHFVAMLLGITSYDVWYAVGDIESMKRIADGSHPACREKQPA